MHQKPHLDEIVAWVLLSLFGDQKYTGIAKAPVMFASGNVSGTQMEHDANGVVLLGVGGYENSRYDEHLMNGKRLKGECCATLVAKDLGIYDRPELRRLLHEVLIGDSTDHGSIWGEMVKMAYRQGVDPMQVVRHISALVKLLIKQEQYQFTGAKDEVGITEIFEAWLAESGLTDERVVRSLRSVMDKHKSTDRILTLGSMVKALLRSGDTVKNAGDAFGMWFNTLAKDSAEFWKRVDELKKFRPHKILALADVGGRQIEVHRTCLFVAGNQSVHTAKAYRLAGFDMCVIRSREGGFQIFVDKMKMRGIRLDDLFQEILLAEVTDGKDRWYYFEEGQMIFNGSLTHERPPSRIPNERMLEIILHSFHPEGLRRLEQKRNGRNPVGGCRETSRRHVADVPTVTLEVLGQQMDAAIGKSTHAS